MQEYLFRFGFSINLSLSEVVNVFLSEGIEYKLIGFDGVYFSIAIDNDVDPSILAQLLGSVREIIDIDSGLQYIPDIKGYKHRELDKPYVDSKSGLLPVRLAKTMVNLAFTKDKRVCRIYDPFTGTGTILAEALVMGIDCIGSDISKKSVVGSMQNINWLKNEYNIFFKYKPVVFLSSVSDVDGQYLRAENVDAFVTEPYLGTPSKKIARLDSKTKDNIKNVNDIISNAVILASKVLSKGNRLVLIIPRYRSVKGILRLDISLSYRKFGFERVDILKDYIEGIDNFADLLYFRPRTRVIREILILEKK